MFHWAISATFTCRPLSKSRSGRQNRWQRRSRRKKKHSSMSCDTTNSTRFKISVLCVSETKWTAAIHFANSGRIVLVYGTCRDTGRVQLNSFPGPIGTVPRATVRRSSAWWWIRPDRSRREQREGQDVGGDIWSVRSRRLTERYARAAAASDNSEAVDAAAEECQRCRFYSAACRIGWGSRIVLMGPRRCTLRAKIRVRGGSDRDRDGTVGDEISVRDVF